jgi:peptidoglycan/LPS O-acetylase OafA/YrhL
MLLVLSKHPLGAALGRFLSWPIFYPMANLAYCAYLLNPVAAMRAHAVLAPMASTAAEAYWLFAAADLVLTFSGAVLLSVIVERPFMELRRVLVPRS